MYEKKFLEFLTASNIDIDSIKRNNKIEIKKLKDIIKDSILIDTKTLATIEEDFVELKDGCTLFHIIGSDNYLIYQKDICLLKPQKGVYAKECEECKISSMRLCVCNNLYKQGVVMSRDKENNCVYEKKLIDFLLENDINKDLIIAKNQEEYKKLVCVIKECNLFNIKTLMPYEEMKIQILKDNMTLYFKFTINGNTSLRNIACIKKDKQRMTRLNCNDCKISTLELCAFNSVYKTNGIIIKKGQLI